MIVKIKANPEDNLDVNIKENIEALFKDMQQDYRATVQKSRLQGKLPVDRVMEARADKMQYIFNTEVYKPSSRQTCLEVIGRVL